MNEVLHANVFFFITSVAVVVLSVIFIILLYHVLQALRSVRKILARIEKGTEVVSEDLQNIRMHFKKGGLIGGLMKIFSGMTRSTSESKSSHTKNNRKKKKLNVTDLTR